MDSIVTALYDVISGPVGQARDWDRFRNLFWDGAPIQIIGPRKDGGFGMRNLSLDDYITHSGPVLIENGFTEREIYRRTQQWGQMAQIFSTYEGHMAKTDMTVRGINSIQLMHDGSRWWVVSILFEAERNDLPLDPTYLPKH
ncbi:MAG: hypothetical protein KDC71_08975 [Acidobacteria bacterium]|nr:hypothetical protein [Acidobacteriota bacterium]